MDEVTSTRSKTAIPLPPELISEILEHAIEDCEKGREYRALCLRAALVSRTWTGPALRLLHHTLHIDALSSGRMISMFATSPLASNLRFVHVESEFEGPHEGLHSYLALDRPRMKALLKNVEQLRIEGVISLRSAVLSLATWNEWAPSITTLCIGQFETVHDLYIPPSVEFLEIDQDDWPGFNQIVSSSPQLKTLVTPMLEARFDSQLSGRPFERLTTLYWCFEGSGESVADLGSITFPHLTTLVIGGLTGDPLYNRGLAVRIWKAPILHTFGLQNPSTFRSGEWSEFSAMMVPKIKRCIIFSWSWDQLVKPHEEHDPELAAFWDSCVKLGIDIRSEKWEANVRVWDQPALRL